GHREHGRGDAFRVSVVASGHAAGDLHVDELVGPGVAGDQHVDQGGPAGGVQRVGDADLVEAALEPRQVLGPAERASAVDRHDLVDAVAEDEAPVEHRDPGFLDGEEVAVQVDDLLRAHFDLANIIRTLSQARPNQPACSTAFRATSGRSAITLPSSFTRSVPIRSPALIGATSGCTRSTSPTTLSAWPRGTVTTRSASTPPATDSSAPFQTW